MLRTRDSKKNEPMPGWPIDGKAIKRQVGMIYWYIWGNHEFDIRTLRKVVGLPEEVPEDKYFMAKKPDFCGSFEKIMMQLEAACSGRSFAGIIAEHDRLLEEEARAELEQRMAMREKMAKLPKVFKAGDLPRLMAEIEAGADFSKDDQPAPAPEPVQIAGDIPF